MNYFKFHIGDYASATRHLSWDEDMAYRRLLDAYYMREGAIPSDVKQVYRLVGAASKPQKAAVDAVLAEFFTPADDGFKNDRCEEEIATFADKRANAKASAEEKWRRAKAGKPQSDGNANAYANASDSHSERSAMAMLPLTTNHKPEEKKNLTVLPKARNGTRLPDDFEPDASCEAVVEEMRLTRQQSQQAFDNFRDYWRAKPGAAGCKLDWQATFRIWLRKENFNGQSPARGSRTIDDEWRKFDATVAEVIRRENPANQGFDEEDSRGLSGLRKGTG